MVVSSVLAKKFGKAKTVTLHAFLRCQEFALRVRAAMSPDVLAHELHYVSFCCNTLTQNGNQGMDLTSCF